MTVTRANPVPESDLCGQFTAGGVLSVGDAAIARRIAAIGGESDERVTLAVALCVRALRAGSVCVDLAQVSAGTFAQEEETLDVAALPWPEPDAWSAAVASSPLVTGGAEARGERPMRLVDGLLYLERYWGHEEFVRDRLTARLAAMSKPSAHLDSVLDQFFTGAGLAADEPDLQRAAAERAATARLTIIAGGPGTGKTSTVARVLATVIDDAERSGLRRPRIGLAAPTGKAAVRIEESLRAEIAKLPERYSPLAELHATTVHRMLGWIRSSSTRFAHDARNPLPFDLVIVDEASMISLTLMRRLLEALRPEARLVLVGDPDQLTPVEAGAVLADVVRAPGLTGSAIELTHNWRFGSQIAALASAVREGRAADALALLEAAGAPRDSDSSRRSGLDFIATDPATASAADLAALQERVVGNGRSMIEAARRTDAAAAVAALDRHRLLCAHRLGAYGVARWAWQSERWLGESVTGFGTDEWAVGRPLLVNRNQPDVGLYNGDSGVVVATDAGPRAAFVRGADTRLFSAAQVSDVSPLFAMTVHKSQGSQFEHVTLVLPPPDSPLLTRELLYTAITRAQHHVSIIGDPESVTAAVERPVVRASGLRGRLARV